MTSVYGACPVGRDKLIPSQKGTWLALFPIPWGGCCEVRGRKPQALWQALAGKDLQCNVEAVTALSGSSLPQLS